MASWRRTARSTTSSCSTGDTPFLATQTLSRLLAERRRTAAAVLVSGMRPADPSPYGRFVLAPMVGRAHRRSQAESPAEVAIGLCNGGIMVIERRASLRTPRPTRYQQRQARILPDRHRRASPAADGLAGRCRDSDRGGARVNTRAELAEARGVMQRRLRRAAMDAGATLIAPETVFLSARHRARPRCRRRAECLFGPGSLSPMVPIRSFSHLDGATVGRGRAWSALCPAAPRRDPRGEGACRQFRRDQDGAARRRRQGQSPHLSRRRRRWRAEPISAQARSPAIMTASASTAR